jgi:predicted MFS family arabinose efflux permease
LSSALHPAISEQVISHLSLNIAHAVNMGIPKEEASFLLSIVGISSMIGRIINGWLSDRPKVFTFFFYDLIM